MALTVTSRGTGTNNTAGTFFNPGGRTATFAVGSLGVMAIALDNAGSGGATAAAPASWTDAKGNVWTLRQSGIYDNGAASAGIEMAWYTAPILTALLTSDGGTVTWAGGASVAAKAWTWYEVIPGAGATVDYLTGGVGVGATAANGQITTASVAVGDAVIAGYFSENVAAVTGDSDTTNGTWGAQQTATIGATTSGVRVATQQKVQTTTASTQSYDVTVASQDRIVGYIVLHEAASTVLSPAGFNVAMTMATPVVTQGIQLSPSGFSLAMTMATPAVSVSANNTLSPAGFSIGMTMATPAVSVNNRLSPAGFSIGMSMATPSVTQGVQLLPSGFNIAFTGATPVLSTRLSPAGFSIGFTGVAPSVSVGTQLSPAGFALAFSGAVPLVTVGGGSGPNNPQPGGFVVSFTGGVPIVTSTYTITLGGDPFERVRISRPPYRVGGLRPRS